MALLSGVFCLLSLLVITPALTGKAWTCCENFRLESDGLGGIYQSSRLGEYRLTDTSSSGAGIYSQEGGDNYLFYMSDLGRWIVGSKVGENNGGMLNYEDGVCPESLKRDWIVLADGSWQDDSSVKLGCEWKAESCATGEACSGCEIHHEMGGVDYCCARDCDSGRMEISTSGGEVECTCYH